MKRFHACLLAAFCVWSFPDAAQATVEQAKFYKKAFGLDKAPKCIVCHTVEKPKKDDIHDLNEYAKKVKELAAEPDMESYKQAGPAPEK